MIQPKYAAVPMRDDRRRILEWSKDSLTLLCARRFPAMAKLSVHVLGLRTNASRVATLSTNPFAQCFVTQASWPAMEWKGRPDHYEFDLDLVLTPPQRQLENRLAKLSMTDCTGLPGAIARSAAVDVTVDDRGLVIRATTTPANHEAETCVESSMRSRLDKFGAGVWRLHATHEYPLSSPYDPDRFAQAIRQYGGDHATDCYPSSNAPMNVRIAVHAHVDDPQFAISVDTKDDAFASCLSAKLQKTLHDSFSQSRPHGDGTFERYFRIDRDADLTVDVPVETPAARDARSQELERTFNRGY